MPEREQRYKQKEERQQSVEREMQQIDALVQRLRPYENDRPYGLNDAADKAFALVQGVLEPYKATLAQRSIVATCHGSLQYHDPRKLDSDIHLFGWRETQTGQRISDELFGTLENLDRWPTGRGNAEVTFLTFDMIRRDAQRYNRGVPYRRNFDDEWGAEAVASLFTSKLILPEQGLLLDEMKAEARKIARSSAGIRQGVQVCLEDILGTRIARRAEIQRSRKD